MIRLHEFITKIRNCKTIAEERAEYQKEMAAIRESFSVMFTSRRKTNKVSDPGTLPNYSLSICPAKTLTLVKWNALI